MMVGHCQVHPQMSSRRQLLSFSSCGNQGLSAHFLALLPCSSNQQPTNGVGSKQHQATHACARGCVHTHARTSLTCECTCGVPTPAAFRCLASCSCGMSQGSLLTR